MHLNDSFGKNKNLKFVFFHHEQAASMAAESYFRVNSLPCILHTTSGPGGTNAITWCYRSLDRIQSQCLLYLVKYPLRI